MPHLLLELLLWIVFSFFVGCILGCVFRRLFGPEPELVVATAAARPPVAAKSSPAPMAAKSSPTPVAARSSSPVAARSAPAPAAKSAPETAVVRGTAEPPKPVSKIAPQVAPQPPVESGKPQQPKGIATPRGGKPDHLTRISGIGPKIERTLHGLGCFHFDQIASWTPDEIRWVDEHLKFKGRIARDDWQSQARALAGGKAEMVEIEAGKKPRERKSPVRKRAKK